MTARCRAPRCGRPLKTEESKARGYGPVCWRREHPTEPRPPAAVSPVRTVDPDQIPLPLEHPVDLETRKAAIDTVARHALARCVEQTADNGTGRIEWGNYPELDDDTWNAVVDRIDAIAASITPTDEQYQAAYNHLTVQKGQRR